MDPTHMDDTVTQTTTAVAPEHLLTLMANCKYKTSSSNSTM